MLDFLTISQESHRQAMKMDRDDIKKTCRQFYVKKRIISLLLNKNITSKSDIKIIPKLFYYLCCNNYVAMNERILIEGIQNRDKEIFDFVFNYYYSGLCAFSMKYLADHEAAEDLVQDFFVRLWVEGPKLKITTSLKAYLFTAVKNRCYDVIKHHNVLNKYRATLLSHENNYDDSTELMIAEAELRSVIQNCLEKLTPRCREIFELSRIQGVSNKDIAEKLGLSKRTVELQISNAIKILRNELADYLPAIIIAWLLG